MSAGGAETMRLVLDRVRCESNAVCVNAAPALFDMDDDDRLILLVDVVPEQHLESAREAVMLCPVRALHLEEADGPDPAIASEEL